MCDLEHMPYSTCLYNKVVLCYLILSYLMVSYVMLSYVMLLTPYDMDDLTSHPCDIATVYLSHVNDLLTPPYDIITVIVSYGQLNISSI